MKALESLIREKETYARHDENPVLQAMEFDSIAKAKLYVSKDATMLTAEEISATDWAKKRLGVV